MFETREFDLLSSPLEGTNMVEASAGTGKTYAISGLFLRLLLEKKLSVDEILVVTYTKAATEELKDRIRDVLVECIDVFSGGQPKDLFIGNLVKKLNPGDRHVDHLVRSLREFDESAVYTIHGFCQRLLGDNAFEANSPFDTELITDEEMLTKEIVYDFWRKHIYNAEYEIVSYLLHKRMLPAIFLKRFSAALVHTELKVIPKLKKPKITSLKPFREQFETLQKAWPAEAISVAEKLMDSGIKGNSYGTTKKGPDGFSKREFVVSDLIRAMNRFVVSEKVTFPLPKEIEKFAATKIKGSMKKGKIPPEHHIFNICDSLLKREEILKHEMNDFLLFLKGEILRDLRRELRTRKDRKNVRYYNDLLIDVKQILDLEKGKGPFSKSAGKKFKAAMIDEFQDTDSTQYEVFRTLFGRRDTPLFLIGDPKQAIYAFRGADIETYNRAAGKVPNQYTLRQNWRSEPTLIDGINSLFSNIDKPFAHGEINYPIAEPAEDIERNLLKINQESEPPFHLWVLNPDKDDDQGKPLTKTSARKLILKAVSGEISRLIRLGREKRALLGEEPLKERHIAVIVRKNSEARLVQKSLAELQIPSVLYSSGNLFDSREAIEIERVLYAIIQPDNDSLIRAGLSTDMMGFDGEKLNQLLEDEKSWEHIIERFRWYREVWSTKGLIRMFRSLISGEKVRPRLMKFADGERRLTNLLHLSEVLHRQSLEKNLGMAGLTKWLGAQMDTKSPRFEEHQLRLESDEDAVKIVTIHKSKGLEYPIVFCPFAWDGIPLTGEEVVFHDREDDYRLTLDLGSERSKEHKAFAEQELLAENLRLLYVSLTRAKNRCYLVWGKIRGAENSALAYLLHGPNNNGLDEIAKATAGRFLSLDSEGILEELEAFVLKARGQINLRGLPVGSRNVSPILENQNSPLDHRKFSGSITRDWKVSSFSSLISGQHSVPELPDHDTEPSNRFEVEEYENLIEEEEFSGIFAFPKGAKAGSFMHAIFEDLDFAEKETHYIRDLVARKLIDFGFEITWLDTICDMIARVLSTPLDSRYKKLTLEKIQNQDRINEMEFYFPLKKITPETLKDVLHGTGLVQQNSPIPDNIGRLNFAPTRGYMKGFIDLVFRRGDRFFLVDWKSNFLGDHVSDYGPIALERSMIEGFYTLQYLIYTIALDQYLTIRLPGYDYERNFGGIYYIFLRGVDPRIGSECGIFRDFPPYELIEKLRKNLVDDTSWSIDK